MSKVKILNKPTKSKTKNTLAIMHAKTANKPLNKKLKANESKTTKTATKASQNKTAKNMTSETKLNKNQTMSAVKTSKNKTAKPQVNQNANPFVDRYLEFYDDIKIPSRRYDW